MTPAKKSKRAKERAEKADLDREAEQLRGNGDGSGAAVSGVLIAGVVRSIG